MHISRRVRLGATLTRLRLTREYLSSKLGTLDHEVFAVIILDNRHRVVSYQDIFRGTIYGASVHPREVVKEALKQNAAAVVLAHPHPAGWQQSARYHPQYCLPESCRPSQAG